MADLAGSEGLDVLDRRRGGAPEDAGAAVGQLDGEGVLGDVDGEVEASAQPHSVMLFSSVCTASPRPRRSEADSGPAPRAGFVVAVAMAVR